MLYFVTMWDDGEKESQRRKGKYRVTTDYVFTGRYGWLDGGMTRVFLVAKPLTFLPGRIYLPTVEAGNSGSRWLAAYVFLSDNFT